LADFGFSLHHCCRCGILLAYPWNAHVVLQIFDRLTRVDQQGEVIRITFTMPGTIYEKFEVTYWGKHVI
jgi:hypothetical protein